MKAKKHHDRTILLMASLIIVGLLFIPPCSHEGSTCGVFCLSAANASDQVRPMGFQGISKEFIRQQQNIATESEIKLVTPKPAFATPDTVQ
ncbi:MAG: hypothetical protein AAFY70_04740 [Bacteroidota bacterium]